MTQPFPTTLQRLDARLREQVREVAALRLALDIQSERIADAPIRTARYRVARAHSRGHAGVVARIFQP